MRIAISGKSGCGNTTVSHLVAEELGYPMINFTFRTLSEEKGIEFWTFCKMAEESDEFDLEVDRRQVEMALAQPKSKPAGACTFMGLVNRTPLTISVFEAEGPAPYG